jgi:5-methylcytosine-specific restriction endonuclease McrA
MTTCICGRTFDYAATRCRRCCQRDPKRSVILQCVICGVGFKRKRGRNVGLCCSKKCGAKLHAQRGEERRLAVALLRSRAKAERKSICKECGQSFQWKHTTRYCSDDCRQRVARRKSKEYQADKYRCFRASNPLVQRVLTCGKCGLEFTTSGQRGRRFCSQRCLERFHSPGVHAQRARHFGVPYDRSLRNEQVLERDGWRCRLCGCDTPRSLRGTTAPNAPEVDHIVPLSKGGGHTWDNVQCACRRCNGEKGARAA